MLRVNSGKSHLVKKTLSTVLFMATNLRNRENDLIE